MAQSPPTIRVYVVELTHGNCKRDACLADDERFIYDEWIQAAQRMKLFIDRRASGCRGIASVGPSAMTREAYDKLGKDEVDG